MSRLSQVIGNATALSQSDDWTALIQNATHRNCFVPAAISEANGLLPDQSSSTIGTGNLAGPGPSRYRGTWDYHAGSGHCPQADVSNNGLQRQGRPR